MKKHLDINELKKNVKAKKTLGIFLVFLGIFALFTPLTPGSWLFFVGMELLAVRFLFWNRIVKWRNKK